MSATERRKGTRWEQHLARWLRDNGYPHAECATRGGMQVHGDIVGILHLYLEAKNTRTMDLSGWLDKARGFAGPHRLALIVAKRRGHGDPGDAYVIARLGDLLPWLKDDAIEYLPLAGAVVPSRRQPKQGGAPS